MYKTRVVDNSIQTVRNILTDLNRILKNTETFHQNFVRYSIATKPPFENSHLVYNVDIDRYQFWAPTKAQLDQVKYRDIFNYNYTPSATIRIRNYIYYPLNLPYICVVDDISWLREIYATFAFKPEHVAELSKLYGTKLYEYIQDNTNSEREACKEAIETIANPGATKTKSLF